LFLNQRGPLKLHYPYSSTKQLLSVAAPLSSFGTRPIHI
jgi:hypothetical protein